MTAALRAIRNGQLMVTIRGIDYSNLLRSCPVTNKDTPALARIQKMCKGSIVHAWSVFRSGCIALRIEHAGPPHHATEKKHARKSYLQGDSLHTALQKVVQASACGCPRSLCAFLRCCIVLSARQYTHGARGRCTHKRIHRSKATSGDCAEMKRSMRALLPLCVGSGRLEMRSTC
jgi:hypothetical protein